ncbi:hypothetical protein [Tamlana sp. I1]|uniref:hypothetical protein n=1 Tax=Tamlana sp. I1 TaxID=2762061 RepID=UPI00188E6483|nr:hypothetical protein [Tamlana sp. I1]
MARFSIYIFLFYTCFLNAQVIDPNIIKVQERLDSIEKFSADLELEVAISFINIPNKFAKIVYTKNEDTKVVSDDFVLIPKKGLDVSLNQLFKYPFITVDRGFEERNDKEYKLVNIIPTDKKADFSIASVLIDIENDRIIESEINTKKDGSYLVKMHFDKPSSVLPKQIEVQFEIERIRIPLKYMGKEATIDKKKYKSGEVKTGTIFLNFTYTDIIYKA